MSPIAIVIAYILLIYCLAPSAYNRLFCPGDGLFCLVVAPLAGEKGRHENTPKASWAW